MTRPPPPCPYCDSETVLEHLDESDLMLYYRCTVCRSLCARGIGEVAVSYVMDTDDVIEGLGK